MKFKALRNNHEPNEFVHIDTIATTMILYTGDLPKPQPLTATMEGMKDYYKNDIPLPNQITLDDLELVEFDLIESGVVGADIRNKLSSPLNLVLMLEVYFEPNVAHASEERQKLYELIKKEMKQSAVCINYLSDLL